MNYSVLFEGVGGEGVLTTSVILARAASLDGYKVIGTQFHGLAQRGGSIPTHIRFGKNVFSPLVKRGELDLVLALEPSEALRAIEFSSKDRTVFLVDTYPIKSVYVNLKHEKYPSVKEIERTLRKFAKNVVMVDSSNMCREKFGKIIYGNVMMLGVAIGMNILPISKKSMLSSIKKSVPRDLEKNISAFNLGLNFK